MYIGFHAECLLFLSDFNQIWNFLKRFLKNPNKANLMKIHPVGSVLFPAERERERETDRQTDRQTDVTKLRVTFCNFANKPKRKVSK